ncbi:MAG: hypothetical protein ACKOTZ_05595, partial [Chloroflexota bacterium]
INDRWHPVNEIFFGGTFASRPEVWIRGDIYERLGPNRRLRVGVIFERNDPVLSDIHATKLHAALRAKGYRSRLAVLEWGSTHFDVLDMDTRLGQTVLDFAWSVVRRSRPR